jgi:hypothetical protein
MNGIIRQGNVFPSQLPETVQDSCKAAFHKLRTLLSDQQGFYGVDFVIEAGSLDPVLVDLNLARPNWSHYFQLFMDALPEKPPIWSGRYANFRHAAEQNYSTILLKLKEEQISFDYSTGRGIAMLQVSLDADINFYSTKVFVGASTTRELDALNKTLDRLILEA